MTILKSANHPAPHLEANKGDLHREDGSQAVDGAIGYVDPVGEASGQHQHKNVQGDEVNQKDVATPRGDLPREEKKPKKTPSSRTEQVAQQRSKCSRFDFPAITHRIFSWRQHQLRSAFSKGILKSHSCQRPSFFHAINKTSHKTPTSFGK